MVVTNAANMPIPSRVGITQSCGTRMRLSDTVNIPPDTLHWHGAAPDRLFAHLALSEQGEQGQGTAWGPHVTDAEYNETASI